jgi:hypothetical protein
MYRTILTLNLNEVDGTVFDLQSRRFHGSFFNRSQYSGPPNVDMTEAWAHYTETGHGKFDPLIPVKPLAALFC